MRITSAGLSLALLFALGRLLTGEGPFVVIGVSAFLGTGYGVPLAAVMFVAETTGRPGFVVPALLAAVAAELVMGRSLVTECQLASDRENGTNMWSTTA